jgi:hypothetical protein
VGSWINGSLSKLEFATVANDDGDLRSVFLVCGDVDDFRDDVFVPTDHPTEHHVFAWGRRKDQSSITMGRTSPNFSDAARFVEERKGCKWTGMDDACGDGKCLNFIKWNECHLPFR